tara:strand:+ start:347 stop:643 length:297 start_codon:yes stop_codon:yes gene_type:complete
MIEIGIIVLLSGLCFYFIYRAYIIAGVLADTEDYVNELEQMSQYMYTQINESYNEMQKIDHKGSFESDDEAGTTFEILKEVIDNLENKFNGKKKEEVK